MTTFLIVYVTLLLGMIITTTWMGGPYYAVRLLSDVIRGITDAAKDVIKFGLLVSIVEALRLVRKGSEARLHVADEYRARRAARPVGVGLTRLIRLSWLSPTSKRHFLETVADSQRDHHEAMKRGDLRGTRWIRWELRWLVMKVIIKLAWETLKTAMGVYKVIQFFISTAR